MYIILKLNLLETDAKENFFPSFHVYTFKIIIAVVATLYYNAFSGQLK